MVNILNNQSSVVWFYSNNPVPKYVVTRHWLTNIRSIHILFRKTAGGKHKMWKKSDFSGASIIIAQGTTITIIHAFISSFLPSSIFRERSLTTGTFWQKCVVLQENVFIKMLKHYGPKRMDFMRWIWCHAAVLYYAYPPHNTRHFHFKCTAVAPVSFSI